MIDIQGFDPWEPEKKKLNTMPIPKGLSDAISHYGEFKERLPTDVKYKPFKCRSCDRVYQNLNGLISHCHTLHFEQINKSGAADAERDYVCLVAECKKGYKNANGLAYHLEKVHGDGVRLDDFVEKRSYSSRKRRGASDATTDEDETVIDTAQSSDHSDDGGEDHKCPNPACVKAYKDIDGLNAHFKTGKCPITEADDHEVGRKPLKCPVDDCPKYAKSHEALEVHISKAHKVTAMQLEGSSSDGASNASDDGSDSTMPIVKKKKLNVPHQSV